LDSWAEDDDGLVLLDVGQPFLRDGRGRDRLDLAVFCRAYPAALRRPLARWVFPGVVAAYHDLRTVLLDLSFNLLKEGLDELVPVALDLAAAHGVALGEDDVRTAYRADARTWRAVQALRRADRAWQLRVRRRPYPFLLPTEGYRR
jgi:hypothetical protein